jgi:hypothetical protein
MASKEKKLPEKKDDSSFKNEFIRRFKANPFIFIGTIVILVIVIVAFVFVPAIVPETQGTIDLTFGFYDKTPISYVQGNYFWEAQRSLAQQYQSNLDESNYQFVVYQIWRQAFEMTVVQAGMLDEMKRAGYTAPEDVVNREVAMLPQFQENGRFSAAKYRQMDNTSKLALWRQVQDSITAQLYLSDVTGLKSPSQEAAFVSSMASPERRFDFVFFPISSYPDSEIAAYVQANPRLFRVTHLSRISVSSGEREARQILASIQDETTTFEDAARANSQDALAENGGDMGIRMAYELTSDITDESVREGIINLAKGSFSDVIRLSENTWAFFRAEEEPRQADTGDAALMAKVRNYLMGYERGRAEDWLLAEARKFIADVKENGFDSAAANRAMEKKSFGPLPVNYGSAALFPSVPSDIPELSSAATNEIFWTIGFSTPLNSPSEPVVLGDYVAVLYPLEETVQDSEDSGFIEMYFPYWLTSSAEQTINSHFINSSKLDDRFWDVFQYIWNTN